MNLPAISNNGPVTIPQELKDIYMKTVFSGLKEEEAIVAYRLAKRRNLDVEAKQIFFVVFTDKQGRRNLVCQTSIDGFRLIASKTGKYGGSVNARLTIKDRKGNKVVMPHEEYDPNEADKLLSATISVINLDFPQPQTATALYSSYVKTVDGKPSGLWASMPDVMLLKCAESQALRKAFPENLSGFYTVDEMDQAKSDFLMAKLEPFKPSLRDFKPKSPTLDTINPSLPETKAIPESSKKSEQTEELPSSPPSQEADQVPASLPEPPPPRKKQTVEELLASIPDGLRKMKPDIDPDIFDYCKSICLDFLELESVKDSPEERVEELRGFMRTTMLERLREYNYL